MAEAASYGTGRRKSSTARVFLRPGTGRVFVNKKPLEEYFPRETLVMDLRRPLVLTENGESFDAYITVKGGGKTGQAGAVRLGLSCAARGQPRLPRYAEARRIAHPRFS